MESLKLAGIQKGYEATDTIFTKKGMWPERYRAEIKGISLASQSNINTPSVIASSLDRFGGRISMYRIYNPRLDQVLWGNPNPLVFKSIGEVLAIIHSVNIDGNISMNLVNRRFQDLERDIINRSRLPHRVVSQSSNIFKNVCAQMKDHKPCFTHGDYTIQNIFSNEELTVFDWEHSCVCSPIYDIGTALSFMILLVTDGGWSFEDYFNAVDYFISGYESLRSLDQNDKLGIEVLRLLGHRQVPQYYLFTLEYLAMVENNQACMSILKGDVSTRDASNLLFDVGLNFDSIWCSKIIKALQNCDYRPSTEFWYYHNQG